LASPTYVVSIARRDLLCNCPQHDTICCAAAQDGKWVICWVKEFSDSAELERLMEK
jgi:hypothetical protein